MKGFRTLIKLGAGVAVAAGAAAFALASPITANAWVTSVIVIPPPPQTEGAPWSGLIAVAAGGGFSTCDDHCSAIINWGDGTALTTITNTGTDGANIRASHTWTEAGTWVVTVEVMSWFGGRTGDAVSSAPVTVLEAALDQPSNAPFTTAEGATYIGAIGSFFDHNPYSTADDFTGTIHWGDNTTSPASFFPNGNRWRVVNNSSHVYRMAGTYNVSVDVHDQGQSVTVAMVANVYDASLTVTGAGFGWHAGQQSTVQIATFDDANAGAIATDFTVTIDWGDGTSSAGSVTKLGTGHFAVTGTHTYPDAGTFTAGITVHDAGGAQVYGIARQGVDQIVLLPALSNGAYGGFQTSIYVQNVGSSPALVSILYYDANGTQIGAGETNSALASHTVWTVPQNNGHSLAANTAGYGVVSSSQPIAAFVNEFAPNGGDASSYTAIKWPSQAAQTLFAPAIANRAYGGYTTGIGMLNFGPAGTITITYRDNLGVIAATQVLQNVASNAYVAVYTGDAGVPVGFSGTATIQGPGPVAAVVNETGPNGQFSSYDAVSAGSTTLYAPVALNGGYGGFFTGMGIQNTSSTGGTVTIDYYDNAGVKTEKTKSIAANGYIGLYQGDVNDGPPPSGTGYTAVLSSTVPIAAVVNETAPPAANPSMSTSYNTFQTGLAQTSLPLVENAGADGWSTGLGVMNTGSQATTVTLSYYDAATGNPVGSSQTQTIQPNSFWGPYQPAAGLPVGARATAVLTTSSGGQIAVICNETSGTSFMSYDGQ